jgi:LacI family transcriptional regulator
LPKPAGIFCSNDQVAAHVHHVGIHCGLDLHRDVCLLGVDNQLDYCEAVHPPFSSVALGMIGFLAAETLQRLMSGQSAPAVTYVAPRGVISRGEGETEADLPSEVKTVMQLIASHMGQVSSIDDLLRNVPLSRRYMEKRFKQATGRSIYQEIQRQRIERASMLLATTRWPVERGGKAAGFSNPRQFSRVFRQFTQSTPRDYRQRRNRESRGAVDGGHDMA